MAKGLKGAPPAKLPPRSGGGSIGRGGGKGPPTAKVPQGGKGGKSKG